MGERPPQPQGWRARLKALFSRERDVIVAEIGAGAQDVIVGKNIIRIGSLVIPALPAIIALLVALSLAAFVTWWATVPAKMDSATFNVAIADFGQISQGRVAASDDGRLASRMLFTTLQAELQEKSGEETLADYRPSLWHDSMSFLEKRATIGLITGVDAEARRRAACARARELNADVLVYGYLNVDADPPTVEQEFCLRTLKRDLGDIGEIESTNRVGMPIPVDLPLDGTQAKATLNAPLRVRNVLTTQIVIGLSDELSGSYDKARRVFEGALAYLERSREPGGAPGSDGEDVVRYFIGREYFFLGQNRNLSVDEQLDHFAKAQAQFEQALANPGYLRARLALGSTFYQRAQLLAGQNKPFDVEIQRAIEEQSQVLREASPNDNRSVLVQGALSLGLSHWLDGYRQLLAGDQALAEAAFAQARNYAEFGSTWALPDEHRFIAAAHMIDGLAYDYTAQGLSRSGKPDTAREQLRQAEQAYAACAAEGASDRTDVFLQDRLIATTCQPALERVRAQLAS